MGLQTATSLSQFAKREMHFSILLNNTNTTFWVIKRKQNLIQADPKKKFINADTNKQTLICMFVVSIHLLKLFAV